MASIVDEIFEKIKSFNKVAMSLHYGPDGDSVGSCLAMKYVLERDFGVKVDIYSKDNLDKIISDFDFVEGIIFGRDLSEVDLESYDALIMLDSASTKMFYGRDSGKEFIKDKFTINIDHHDTNSNYADINYVVGRASCCSILLDMFQERGIQFDEKISNSLLLGIATDSGFFQFSNGAEAINDASLVIEKGADYKKTIVGLLSRKPLNSLLFEGLVINRLRYDEKLKMGYSIVPFEEIKKLGLGLSDIRFSSNLIQNIDEFDFVFTLVEVEKSIKGSFRSSKGVDVSLFAKALGGGGHKPAAGFSLEKMSLDEAKDKVFEVVREIGINRF